MKPTILFDMNETLLDMSSLDSTFAKIFEPAAATETRKKWFKQVLELFLTATVIDEYRSFDKLTDDSLQMIAAQRGREASADDRAALKKALAELRAYPDVQPGLRQLKQARFTVATLTNSTEDAARKLVGHAGLDALFDQVLSADAVKRYKPARDAYEYAAEKLGVKTGDICLVAAHGWDIAGAHAAGCQTAFIARPEKVLSPGAPKPGLQARDVSELAAQLVARHA